MPVVQPHRHIWKQGTVLRPLQCFSVNRSEPAARRRSVYEQAFFFFQFNKLVIIKEIYKDILHA